MFVERNEFYLHFGHSKEAITLWKEWLEKAHQTENRIKVRFYSDLTGDGYTIVLELQYDQYSDLEPSKCLLTQQKDWGAFYRQFIPLCKGSKRTLYKLEVAY